MTEPWEHEVGILCRVLEGDRAAAASFVRRYRATIEATVRRVYERAGWTPSREDVEDAVNETWLSLFDRQGENLRRYRVERGRLSSWIALMARNRTLDRLKTAYVRRTWLGSMLEEPSPDPGPPEQLELRERCSMAERAFERLAGEDRRFLEAWYVQQREPAELAAELGVTVTTVYTRRLKLQQKMARQLASSLA